jgi:hypothetical protein
LRKYSSSRKQYRSIGDLPSLSTPVSGPVYLAEIGMVREYNPQVFLKQLTSLMLDQVPLKAVCLSLKKGNIDHAVGIQVWPIVFMHNLSMNTRFILATYFKQ